MSRLLVAVVLLGGYSARGTPPDFESEEAFFALEEEIVTATRAPSPLIEAPAVVAVITRAEIERHAWRSVGEALRSVPGLFGYHDGVTWAYSVRGVAGGLRANARVLKVLLNGRPIADRYDTTNHLGRELVPIGAVERIEVIRGPASALYGADAFLGVVNVIVRGPPEELFSTWEIEGGLDEGGRYTGGAEITTGMRAGPVDAFAAVSFSWTDRSGLAIPESSPKPSVASGETLSEGDVAAPTSALARFGLTLGEHRVELFGRMGLLDGHREFSDQRQLTHGYRVSVLNALVGLRYSGELAPGHRLVADVGWAGGGPQPPDRIDVGSSLNHFVAEQGYDAVDASLEWRWAATDWLTLTLGADQSTTFYDLTRTFKVLETDSPTLGPAGTKIPHAPEEAEGRPDEATFWNIGVFAQAVARPLHWLAITAGGRYDEHSLYGSRINGRGALVFRPVAPLTIKVLAGSSFKAPSPLHLYAPQKHVVAGDIVGNPDLGTEEARTIEWAAIVRPLEGLSLSLASYLSALDGKVEFVQEGSDRQAQNNTDVSSVGVEADLRYQWGGLTAWATLAWDRSRREVPPGESELLGDAVLEVPTWSGAGGVAYRWAAARLRLAASVHWAGERRPSQSNLLEAGETYVLPGYAVLDLAVTTAGLRLWGDRETRVAFRVADLLDAAPVQPGYGGVDLPQPGRWFQLSLRQEF